MPCSGPIYLTNLINQYVDQSFDFLEAKPKSCLNTKTINKLEKILRELGIDDYQLRESLLYGLMVLLVNNLELDREECRKVLQEAHVIIENAYF